MRITAVKIGARTFAVDLWPFQDAEDEGARGDFNYRTGRIRIADGYAPSAQVETLLHEIIHALLKDSALDFSNDAEEERIVERLSPRLAAFLVDNPDVVREIMAMLGCVE